ncbi:MAG: hypothetical protein AB7V22_09985 [Kiritimatiellia bacterium]
MNVFRTPAFRLFAGALALPLAALFWTVGCDVDSVDSTTSTLADNEGNVYNYSGLYMNTEEGSTNGFGALVFPAGKQSGAVLIWLRLLQYGSVLEGYDSAGLTWAGSLSAQNGSVASFNLQGRTTAGQSVEIAGTLSYADQQSTLDAAWIEPNFAGSIFAQAAVSPVATNSPIVTNTPTDVSLVASSYNVSVNEAVTLTASGGSTYTWSATSYGSLVASGNTAAYTRTSGTSANSEIVTVSSGGDSASVTLEFD